MKRVLQIIYRFIRGIFRFLALLISSLFNYIILKITYEKGTEKKLTKRKAKRIRFFTNCKLFIGKYLPHFANFIGIGDYITNLKERLNYGV